jgi:type IV pilus assembly protein PilA
VAEAYASRGALPRDRRAAGLAPSPDSDSGLYVESIDVSRGVLTITYGNQANARLSGRTLVMRPFATASGDMVWLCGFAMTPAGLRPLVAGDAGALTTIEPKYLPSACR